MERAVEGLAVDRAADLLAYGVGKLGERDRIRSRPAQVGSCRGE
jgi:hypothetical protein